MTPVQAQLAFAANIRQPGSQPLPAGIADERMAIYQTLFFNNVDSLLASNFPVLRRVLAASRWQVLVGDFLAGHRAATPYFLELGQEFIGWLQQGYQPAADDPPWLLELAHYEWVELALDISEAELPAQGWSALAWPLAYRWPVQRIGADYCPEQAPDQATCLLVWRDASERVRFMQLAPFAYCLAQRLQAGAAPAQALLALAEENGLTADTHYYDNARALLVDWQARDIWFPAED